MGRNLTARDTASVPHPHLIREAEILTLEGPIRQGDEASGLEIHRQSAQGKLPGGQTGQGWACSP